MQLFPSTRGQEEHNFAKSFAQNRSDTKFGISELVVTFDIETYIMKQRKNHLLLSLGTSVNRRSEKDEHSNDHGDNNNDNIRISQFVCGCDF